MYRRMSGTLLALYRGVAGALVVVDRRVVGTLLRLYRRVARASRALHFGVARTLLALYRGMVGALLASYRGAVAALLALYRGVAGVVLALHRQVVKTLPGLRRRGADTLQATHRGVARIALALWRGVTAARLALSRGVTGALLALHHRVVETLPVLRQRVVETLPIVHRRVEETTLAVYCGMAGALLAVDRRAAETLPVIRHRAAATYASAREHWNASAGLFEAAAPIGAAVGSRIRRFSDVAGTHGRTIWRYCSVAAVRAQVRLTRDIRTLEPVMAMAGRHVSLAARTVHERCRVSLLVLTRHVLAIAHQPVRMRMPSRERLKMHLPLWMPSVRHVRLPALNVTLAAFAGGTAVGAFAMWLFGGPSQSLVPDRQTRLTDSAVTRVPAVASRPVAGPQVQAAAVYAASFGTMPPGRKKTPVAQRAVAPSSAPAPVAAMPAAMTVVSTPVGARVTVDGIGWGETPVTIRHLPPGQKVVRVTKDGYASQQRIISVADDRRSASVRVVLRAVN